jgi:hypothetical protein
MDEVTRDCCLPFSPRRLYLKTPPTLAKLEGRELAVRRSASMRTPEGPRVQSRPAAAVRRLPDINGGKRIFSDCASPNEASRRGRTNIVDLLRSEANLLEGPLPSEGKGHSFRYDPFRKFGSRYMPKTRATRAAIATKPDLERRKGMSSGCSPPLHDHARRTFCISAVGSGA